jgi:tagatose-1,6-bisphosphate aldolase
MALLLGTQRGLAACASASGRFSVLALDHRQNLRHELRPEDPSSVTNDEMASFKLAIIRALATHTSGVLLDPEVGVAPAIAGDVLPARVGLLVAVEATGYEGSAGDRRSRVLDGWSPAAIRRTGASAAKLLVYYHPDAPGAPEQERLIADVLAECRALDLPLFVEPLSFGLDGGKLAGEDRRRVVIRTAERLTALGPDILKAEFPYDPGVIDQGRWVDALAELDAASRVPWVLLSGGVEQARFEAQLEAACRAGASGALVGRSVWAEAARLPPDARDAFLAAESVTRMTRLTAIVETHARPWRARWQQAHRPDEPGEGWYAGY